MMLRNDIKDVLTRTKKLYNEEKGVLIQIKDIKDFYTKPKNLNSFGLPNNMESYLDYKIDRFIKYWKKRENLRDDLLPAITPWYGIAEHSAFIGGEVDFSDNTSWHHKLINSYEDMDKLVLNENNIYLKLVIEGMKYLKKKSKGRYFVKLRGANGPMDIANVIRGNDIFYDFFEKPDNLKILMNFCKEAARFTLNMQKNIADNIDGGIITGFDTWMEGNSIGHISEDASTMISNAHYNEFGRPFTLSLVSEYDHVFMHIHALGAHNIPNIVTIPNIDFVEISNDPNCKRAIEVYKDYENILKNKVTCVLLTLDEIRDNIGFLKENKTIIWYDAINLEDANEAISLVREI